MSANKSWDIQPNRPVPRPVAPAPARKAVVEPVRKTQPARESVPRPIPTRREAVRPVKAPKVPGTLRARRRGKRRTLITTGIVILLALLVGVVVLLWQPFLRIETIQADGPGSDGLPVFVKTDLAGTTYGILPKNSIFFISQKELRAHILTHFPVVQAVSITPTGLTGLTIQTVGRATSFWWCGISRATPSGCFETDTDGKLFMQVPSDQLSASSSVLLVYAALKEGSTTTPLGDTLVSAKALPNLLEFVKTARSLNADVVSVELREDEADLYTAAGTRITYVLGREQQAAALSATAFPTLNLNDGSLLYVDLRFDSKIFFKKKTALKK